MFARVIAAGDVRQRIPGMVVCCLCQNPARWIVAWKRCSNIPHTPGAAQIQTIEMNQFRIRWIRNGGRNQQGARLSARESRQKAMKPAAEFSSLEDATHEIS